MSDMIEPVRATIARQYTGMLAACDRLRDYAIAMKSAELRERLLPRRTRRAA